jgi:hypothetical protein
LYGTIKLLDLSSLNIDFASILDGVVNGTIININFPDWMGELGLSINQALSLFAAPVVFIIEFIKFAVNVLIVVTKFIVTPKFI